MAEQDNLTMKIIPSPQAIENAKFDLESYILSKLKGKLKEQKNEEK